MRLIPLPVVAGASGLLAAAVAAGVVALGGVTNAPAASATAGYHGWCVDSVEGLYIVLEGAGAPPQLVAGGQALDPVTVIPLHAGAHLDYYRLPEHALPRALSALTDQGVPARTFISACATQPPSTA